MLKIPVTMMVVGELCVMMLGVRITVGGAGGGDGGGEGGGGGGGDGGGGEGEGGGGEGDGGGGEGDGGGGEGEGGDGDGGGGEGGGGGGDAGMAWIALPMGAVLELNPVNMRYAVPREDTKRPPPQ